MDQSFTEAKDTAIALKYLTEAKALLRQDDYSFKEVEELLLKASKSTRYETYLELARLYERHNIFDEALKWYMRKYNHSMLETEDTLKVASWYEQGIGTDTDYNMAVKLYTRKAFSNDEALKSVIRLYKDKNASYMGTSAYGLMTLEKWEDEARKRGVKDKGTLDKENLDYLEAKLRESFKNDPTIDEVMQSIYPDYKPNKN
jgi:predicted HTH domain antitoxin